MTKASELRDFLPAELKVCSAEKALYHQFDKEDLYAAWSAYAAGRPLLLRGAPGTGKSQMAKALAAQLGWAYVPEVIRGSTELGDLHWHYDAIGRLGEAQAASLAGDQSGRWRDPANYLSPGAFWWAYEWDKAETQYARDAARLRARPCWPQGQTPPGVVLLIDEIDKADPDLPNGLLETLGHFEFNVPYLNVTDTDPKAPGNPIKADPKRLLVVITTNEERELPTAFVRRCFVHTLKMETSREQVNEKLEKRHQWLVQRGKLHFDDKIDDPVYQDAAILLWKDRDARSHTRYPPGLAEYIDLLQALSTLPHDEQAVRLKQISPYALNKEVDL